MSCFAAISQVWTANHPASGNRIVIPKCDLVQVCAFLVKDHLREFTHIQQLESKIKFGAIGVLYFTVCLKLGAPLGQESGVFKMRNAGWFSIHFKNLPGYTYQGISELCKSCCDCPRLGAKIGPSPTLRSRAVCWEERFSISKGHWPLAQLELPSPSWPNQRCNFDWVSWYSTFCLRWELIHQAA